MSADFFDLELIRVLDAQPNESLLEAARRVVAERNELRRALDRIAVATDGPVRQLIRGLVELDDPAAKGHGAVRRALYAVEPSEVTNPVLRVMVHEWRAACHWWGYRCRWHASGQEEREQFNAEFRLACQRLAAALKEAP